MIAVFDLETTEGVSKSVSRPLSESIRREVFKSGKWELIDRGNMDKIRLIGTVLIIDTKD